MPDRLFYRLFTFSLCMVQQVDVILTGTAVVQALNPVVEAMTEYAATVGRAPAQHRQRQTKELIKRMQRSISIPVEEENFQVWGALDRVQNYIAARAP
jgi:hypothetical protein